MSDLPPAPESVEIKLKHSQGRMRLMWGRYDNGRVALELADDKTGEPIARCTVNIPDIAIDPDQTFIKDWSENEGMVAALESVGIVRRTVIAGLTNMVQAPVCRWAVALPEIPQVPER